MVSTYLKDRKLLETAKHRGLWYNSVIQSIHYSVLHRYVRNIMLMSD